MKKFLLTVAAGAFLSGCATKTLETPEGTYRWQRGTFRWVPGKWIQQNTGIVPLPTPSPAGGSAS